MFFVPNASPIIPLREKTGNYDRFPLAVLPGRNYTTTRENRELRPSRLPHCSQPHYTTTRENRELRPFEQFLSQSGNYTTTRENRELRHCSPLQELHADYTTTRENRELRPLSSIMVQAAYYTTTRENRELRPGTCEKSGSLDYTTTRENKELRLTWLLPFSSVIITKLSVLSTPAAMSANLKCSIGIIKADLIFPCYFLSFACGVGVLWYNYFVRL